MNNKTDMDVSSASPEELEILSYLMDQDRQNQLKSQQIKPRRSGADLPLSFAQQRLWVMEQMADTGAAYNWSVGIRAEGPLSLDVIEKCLTEISRRHEVLRTTIDVRDEVPIQVIHEPLPVPVEIKDLSDLPAEITEDKVRDILSAFANDEIDLETGPVLRSCLLRLGEQNHILFLTMHHVVSDGWSLGVLLKEFIALYEAFLAGKSSPLAELPVQYADYAVWQRNWLVGDELERQLGYWEEKLRDVGTLDMPTDRGRPPVPTYKGGKQDIFLDDELNQALKQFAQQEDVTLFILYLATFKALLHRYCGQDDIVVGTPVANRNRVEIEGLIGFFVNMLVLRTDVSENPSFQELLNRTRDTAHSAYKHQDLPFERLVEALKVDRDMSRNPLFQVCFSLQENQQEEVELEGGLSMSPLLVSTTTARFDLELFIKEGPGKPKILAVYNTDLFDAATIKRMLRHYANLLSAVVAEPGKPIDFLPMLEEQERNQIVNEWNQTQTEYPRHQTVHALFEQQAAATPDSIAVVYENETLSYARLNEQANQLAHYLQVRGVGPEVMVGLFMERSQDMIIGILGILKAGGAYLPLDLEYPSQRIAFMLEDAAVPVLLTQSTLCERLPSYSCELICLDTDRSTIVAEPATNPDGNANADNLAYVIYTSGSTGQPKGVEIPHRAINRLVRNTDYFQADSSDRVAQVSNISFDAGTFELWGALLNGAQLIFVNKNILLNPRLLATFLQEQRISAMFLTTALFNQIAREVPDAFNGLRGLMFGGEAVDPGAVRQVMKAGSPKRLLHVYGPTESTTFASWYQVEEVPNAATTVPIGRPLANTTLYVLDKHRHPVPIGVPGELYIGGDGLARGYLNRPKLTTEKFVPNPFSEDPAARLYRTGDLVRYSSNGAIEFIGRIDHQVKLRGYRIELGEIETALIQQESICDVVVIVHKDEAGDKRLVAYVMPSPEWREQNPYVQDTDPNDPLGVEKSYDELIPELRQHLREQLPAYMVPSLFIVLDEFPINANGKLDRQALPDPGDIRASQEAEYTAPRNETEEKLVQIWAEVLKLEQVGVHDNFFDLGGHSLMATQVVSRIRGQLNVEIRLSEIFNHPTVAELEPIVKSLINVSDAEDDSPIVRLDRAGDLPLSFAQERLWFLDQLQPGNPAYIIPMALRLKGKLRIDALLASLNLIVERHEALRTRFVDGLSGPVQIVDSKVTIELKQTDLGALSGKNAEDEIWSCLATEKKRPFDLANDALIRASLLRLNEEEHVLLLTMHHIISDGWSLGVLVRELGECYAAFSQGQQPKLAELPIQYVDFAAWQRQWLSEERLDEQLDYWRRQLEDLQVLDLPTDRTRPAIQSHDGAHEILSLDKQLSAQLNQLSKDSGVTLFMTLLTVFMAMLHRYSHQDDIVIGTPIANRNRSEVEGLIAFFVNMLVMRVDCSGTPDFNQLVERVSDMAVTAYEHQDIPFEQLVEVLQVDRDPSRNPLFQVEFSLQNAPLEALRLEGLSLEPVITETQVTRFDLECHISDRTEQLQIGFVYNSDLFDAATIKRMLHHYVNLLSAVVAEPERPIDLLPMLDVGERGQLVEEWNRTQTEYPRHETVHALFEQQAASAPERIALEYADQHLSYGQLNQQANQLAHYLQARGVGPEVIVGICVERSLEMVIGLLAILKSGGAYLPLDSDYPQSRLDFMLADAEAPVLLTHSSLQGQFTAFGGETVCVDSEWSEIARESTDNPVSGSDANSLMYAIYTSGSTGRPKGTLIEHRSAVRLVRETNYIELGADEVFLQFAPISFDASTLELWGSLLNGARLVVFPAGRSALEELGQVIQDRGVTTLWLTSALFSQMVDNHLASLSGIRQLLAGGEALSLPHVKKLLASLDGGRLINGYGPTENTTFTCCHVMTRHSELGQSVPIGRPISNTTVYILDGQMSPVPVGVAGELYIGGDGLARGYLNQPELTAEKFVADPFSDEANARLYRTGDLVRYRSDGVIEFIGRIDHQVKVRGYRIELGEIETVLVQQAAVSEAVVLVREDESGDKRLVAYVVPTREWQERHPPDEAAQESPSAELIPELRQQLREQLPSYMLPSLFVVLEAFPLNANGKLDRQALPDPTELESGLESQYVAPRTEMEARLAGIWAEVLKLEQVGVHDNFFDLGGHSLMATQVVSRIRGQLNVELPLAEIFAYPTLAELTPVVEALNAGDGDDDVIPRVSRDGRLPLSFAQERLWFLDQLQPGNPAYIIPLVIRMKGNLSLVALMNSLNAIVRHQEVLHTHFVVHQGKPFQAIEYALIELPQDDLSSLAAEDQGREIQARIEEEASRQFDLSKGPLLHSKLLRLSDHEHVLLLTMHHIISDGWSLGVMFKELGKCYAAFSEGEQPVFAELPIQYADFAAWQRQWLSGEVLASQQAYWQQKLADLETLNLPTDRPRPTIQTYAGAFETLKLDAGLRKQLEELSKHEGVTLFMTLLGGFAVLMHRYSGQDDIVIGSPIANRNRSELEELIGFFINMLVMRLDLSEGPGFRELLSKVQETAMGAFEHQDIPFEKLVELIQVNRDRSRNPLFQVQFALQNAPIEPLRLEGLTLEPSSTDIRTTRFDLECNIWTRGEELDVVFIYNTDLFDEATIKRMLHHYRNLLSALVLEPERSIAVAPMLDADEKYLMLEQWNQTSGDYRRDITLSRLYQVQAERCPDATAVECDGEALSYAELDLRSNQFARYLQAQGVGPEVMVGLCLERSLDLIVAILGILKAGGAYVPLDPKYPRQRLEFILDDCSAPILVTQNSLQTDLPDYRGELVCLDTDWPTIEKQDNAAPCSDANAGNSAYVIYTSGSTGQPKGVVVTHDNVTRLFEATEQWYGFNEADVWTLFHSSAFDFSVWEIWGALLHGGRLVVVPFEISRSPDLFHQLLVDAGVTVLNQTPSAFRQFIVADENKARTSLSALRLVIFGGEALDPQSLEPWFEKHGEIQPQLVNMYGITETTVHVSYRPLTSSVVTQSASLIGCAIPDLQIYILDRYLQPVPVGVPGEMYIGGAGLARGYLNRPELTAERFIVHPFSDQADARLYKTGDLARYLPDGDIEYLGRTDHQVKLRGFRIELGEIESLLGQHGAIREAVVLCRNDQAQGQRLVAYVVSNGSGEIQVSDLRAHVRQQLPEYMVPSAFLVLDSFPLTPNGKLDRRVLPDPETEQQSEEVFVEPRSEMERQLVAIWREVLGVSQIGIHDNFFVLGGQSLMATQVRHRVLEQMKIDLKLAELFDYPTVAELSQKLEMINWTNQAKNEEECADREVFRI